MHASSMVWMLEPVVMNEEIERKEQECVKVSSKILAEIEREQIDSLTVKILNYYSNSFSSDGGLSLDAGFLIYLFVQLPLAVVCTPLGIPYLIWCHIVENRNVSKIESRYLSYDSPDIHHIGCLWDKYGLTDSLSDGNLSEVASKWIGILYPNQLHIAQNEIQTMFINEEKEQSRIYNEYHRQGMRVNLKNWRHVVLEDIFDSLPRYE